MRIGGAFPFSPTEAVGGNGQIALTPGGVFYPPVGNYMASLGSVTGLQMWDGVGQQWRGVGQPDEQLIAFDTDGYNWRLINLSGCITGTSITNAGSAGTNGIGAAATGVTVTFAAPASPGIIATAYPIVGGAVAAPSVAQAGSGFLYPPLVVIDAPPVGGIQATAICTLTGVPPAGILSITMTNAGAGYLQAPNFYLIPQPGSYQGGPTAGGAVAAGAINNPSQGPGLIMPANTIPTVAPIWTTSAAGALLNAATLTGSGTLTGLVMMNYGTNYSGTTIPAITITGCGAAAATALGSFVLLTVTLGSGGTGYGSGVAPNFITSMGVVAATDKANVFSSRIGRGVTTLGGGAVATFVVEDQGFGLQKVPIVSVLNTSAVASTQATGTAVVGGVNDISYLQSKINS